ncbi:MAG: hypothetical protein GY934_19660 [Gammaproteobacteria bacterium]|nr:hypothetical protein [Gammaproteobacteria bacterium]
MGRILSLHLLGPVQVEWDDEPARSFESRKALALLCYLAVQDQPISRSHLADVFWGDKPEMRGRANLSRVLTNLSTLVPHCLQTDRHQIQCRYPIPFWLDVVVFEELVSRADAASLAAAVALYQGDFMAEFYLDDCPEFETWLVVERERWQRRVAQPLQKLITHHNRRTEYELGLGFASRLLELDPWREEAHQQMMHLLVRSGQRSAALVQYETCRRILAEKLAIEPTRETTALYERIRALGRIHPHNLPPQQAPLIGREDELAEIAGLLSDPACRLLTLIGPGGVGKTRIALQAATHKAKVGAFLEGVYFVSLATSSVESLAATITDTLQFPLQGSTDPKTQLLNYLCPKEILLVLDNYEHLLAPLPASATDEALPGAGMQIETGTNVLVEILANAPAVKLLVTSRERLNIRQEWLRDIQGLSCPNEAETGLERIEKFGAVRLFVQRAQQIQNGFSLSARESPGLVRICRLVEGMPLGIELATAWVRTLSCQEIAREIECGFKILATPRQDVAERHRSMQAMFEHSWRLLAEPEREVFRKLSVFRGGFQQEAAQEIAGASPVLLSVLVDKSFLRRNPAGRYETHELLRQYAAEKLVAIPEEKEKVQNSHCGYYTRFLHRREEELHGQRQREALKDVQEEIENVRIAWHRAADQGQVKEIGQSLESLFVFYEFRGWFQEGESVFQHAAFRLVEIIGRMSEGATEEKIVQGQVLARQGWFCWRLGRYRESRELLRKSLTSLRQTPRSSWQGMGFAFMQFGFINWYRGDYSEAQKTLQESLTIAREASDLFLEGMSLTYLGLTMESLGEYHKAELCHQEGLIIHGQIKDERGIAFLSLCLGRVANVLGKYKEARQLVQEALITFQGIKGQFGLALGTYQLGMANQLAGEYEAAQQRHLESVAIFKEIGDQWGTALALTGLGYATCSLGKYKTSRQHFHESLKIATEIETLPVALEALVGLAMLLITNEPGDAERERAAEQLAMVLDHPAASQETKNRAAPLLAELESQLPTICYSSKVC